jgi:hypothetical protein
MAGVVFSIHSVGIFTHRMKLDFYLTQYTNINSKWANDLNIRFESINLLEGITGKKLHDIGL